MVAPARLPETIAVAGVTADDGWWSGSSYGPEVDFSAPAAGIRRASVRGTDRFDYGDGGDGPSYAAALTSGVAALWLLHHRVELAQRYAEHWQRIEAFRLLARLHVRVPAGWNAAAGFGPGILDAAALLAAALPDAAALQRRG